MTEKLEPDEIYIQLGENRTGLGICLRRWQETPFEGSIKYTRTQPKYKRVDLDEMKQDDLPPFTPVEYMLKAEGWDSAISSIKSKYGDLYAEVKE